MDKKEQRKGEGKTEERLMTPKIIGKSENHIRAKRTKTRHAKRKELKAKRARRENSRKQKKIKKTYRGKNIQEQNKRKDERARR